MEKRILRWGFRGKYQLPLFMLWWEYRDILTNEVTYAEVIFKIR